MKIGVLALQGAFIEHISIMQQLGVEASPVRLSGELDGLDGLIIPGGESTSILNLIHSFNLAPLLKELAQTGLPILGTCAGMICLAKKVSGSSNSNMEPLALMDLEVKRNAFGRQVDSFEADLDIREIEGPPFRAVFIRAPVVNRIGEGVRVLAEVDGGRPVAVRQGRLLATAFHPELTDDFRVHELFVRIVEGAD